METISKVSKTPETDAVVTRAINLGQSLHEVGMTDLCRKLELQRDELLEALQYARDVLYDPRDPENQSEAWHNVNGAIEKALK